MDICDLCTPITRNWYKLLFPFENLVNFFFKKLKKKKQSLSYVVEKYWILVIWISRKKEIVDSFKI